MKKIIILLILIGIGLYFLLFKKEPEPEIPKEEETIPLPKKVEVPRPAPNFLKEEEKPIQRPYLGTDFKPIDPPSGTIPINNKINPNLEDAIRSKIINPDVEGMNADIKKQGTFILVKSGQGLFVEQILITINTPGEDSRTFNAYADAETGELIHTVEPYEASYSSEDMQTTEVEIPEEDRGMDYNSEPPSPDSDFSFPIED